MKPLAAFCMLLIQALAAQAAPPPPCMDMCLQDGHAWSYCTKLCGRNAPGTVPGVPGVAPVPSPAYPGVAPRGALVQPGVPANPLLKQPGVPRNPAFDDVQRSIQPEPYVPPTADRKCMHDCQRRGHEVGYCLRQCTY